MARIVVGCLLGGIALHLALPFTAGPDAFSWLVWGREIPTLDLDTTAGASWKPLPVLFTTAFSAVGSIAYDLWFVVAWAGGLLAVVLAYRLGARLATPLAGAIAAVALVLQPTWLSVLLQGLSEPLTVALVLWAIERHLDGARGQAFALGFLAALARPEAWPFLALYGLVLWRQEPRRRLLIAGLGVAVPLLWLGGDLWGSGDPLTGGERALTEPGEGTSGAEVYRRFLETVDVLVWVGVLAAALASLGLALAGGPRARTLLVLAAGAWGWVAVTIALALVGYTGDPRFMLPAGAVLSVVAGVGAVRLVATVRSPRGRALVTALIAGLAVVLVSYRVAKLPTDVTTASERAASDRDLRAAIDEAGGRDRLRDCRPILVSSQGWRPLLAWELEVPHGAIGIRPADSQAPLRAGVAVLADPDDTGALATDDSIGPRHARSGHHLQPEGSAGEWRVFTRRCR